MKLETKQYINHVIVVGAGIGMIWNIIVEMFIRGNISFMYLLWNVFSFCVAIVIGDFIRKQKIFSKK